MRQDLWAITAYFNPVGYKRRLQNYHVFRQRLTVPLVTVELAFDGGFQLAEGDADILVQLHGGDVMWQKERLLNLALEHVPAICDSIAWLDCDVIFGSDDWAARARRALDDVAIVHLFHERHDVPADADLDGLAQWDGEPTAFSIAYKLATGQASPLELGQCGSVARFRSTNGLAWASRRDVLEAHGLYDANVMGSGDKPILGAALEMYHAGTQALQMNARRVEHYLAWARPFAQTVQRRVGYVPGRIFHLWHGELGNRGYTHRQALLADFDPFADIALTDQGCWRWSSDKPGLHAAVRRYFESRNEDGDETTSSARAAAPPETPARFPPH